MTVQDRSKAILRDVLVPRPLLGGTGVGLPHDKGCFRGDLILRDARAVDLVAAPPTASPRMVLPALVDAHCHLDKCHTVDRLAAVGGDLVTAIEEQRRDKANWTETDLRTRTARGLRELLAAGCTLVRSHVDWGETAEPPLAWRVLADLARDQAGAVTLDLAALTGREMADPGFADAVALVIQRDGGTLGTFVFDQPGRRDGIRAAFAAADRYGLALDFHVDEGLAPGLDGLEMIADIAIETGFQGPVLCGHACSLMNVPGPDLPRLLDKIARSGIAVAALPTTNLYLQGRTDGTPDRRGLTRLRELHAAGVPIVVASDNVADAFCPTGAHDPMAALDLAVLGAHLDPPLDRWLPLVTTNAARALGRDPVFVKDAHIGQLRLSGAVSLSDLISGRCGPPTPLLDQLEALAT